MTTMATPQVRDGRPSYAAAGRHLAELRSAAGMTQEALAEAIASYLGKGQDRAGQRAVSTWERGVNRPTVPNLAALAAVLGADPAGLLELWYPELAAAALEDAPADGDRRLELVQEQRDEGVEQAREEIAAFVARFGRRASDEDLDRLVASMMALPTVQPADR